MRPSLAGLRRLRDDEDPVHAEEGSGGLRRHGRGTERSRHDHVVRAAMRRLASGTLGSPGVDPHTIAEAETVDRVAQKPRSSAVAVEERPRRCRQVQRKNEAGHAAPAAEVDGSEWRFWEAVQETPRVFHVERDRTGSEEPGTSSVLEDLEKRRVRQPAGSGTITTRRRGSSPSDVVVTPGISFAVS